MISTRYVIADCGRVEEITGSVVAEVDVPTSRRVLAALDVVATVGSVKLHVPKDKPVIITYHYYHTHPFNGSFPGLPR